MIQFFQLKIKDIIKETLSAVSLIFDIPGELKDEFTFIAGQYVTIKTFINGEEIRRAYSLCSSPKDNQIKITIKAVENGRFSVYANKELRIGDELDVSKPEGKFILEPEINKNYIGFAAGSGITPVLSMIKSVLATGKTVNFMLIYGNKSVNETIFYKELNDLNTQYSGQFYVNYVFSREHVEGSKFGRIDKARVNYFLKNKYKDINFEKVFLCGPEEMINIVSETLSENGFTENSFSYELFTSSVNEEDAKQIKEIESQITVVLDDEETMFTMKQNSGILAEILRQKIDAPHSCQGGVCSSCIAKVTEGKAIMIKNQILTNEELEEGFILTCQAHPVTSKITVDFDNV